MSVRLALSLAAAMLIAAMTAIAPGAASAAATEVSADEVSMNDASPEAERYFTCPSGYSFRATADAAHCKKPDSYQTTPLVACTQYLGVGLFARRDHAGYKDMCAGTNPITGEVAVERSCILGYSKRIVRGEDQCRKLIEGTIVAPTVAVSR